MKNFEEMSFDELMQAQQKIAEQLFIRRNKVVQEKIAAIAEQIRELERFINIRGGDSGSRWETHRLDGTPRIDLIDITWILEDIDPKIFFEEEPE